MFFGYNKSRFGYSGQRKAAELCHMKNTPTIDPALADKVYLITGGTSGVGQAIATGLAAQGAKVVIVSRTAKSGQQGVRHIARILVMSGRNSWWLTCPCSPPSARPHGENYALAAGIPTVVQPKISRVQDA